MKHDDDDDIIEYLIFDKAMREGKKENDTGSGCCLSGCLAFALIGMAAIAAVVAAVVVLIALVG